MTYFFLLFIIPLIILFINFKVETKINIFLFCVYIFPFFHSYLSFLPLKLKWVTDIFLIFSIIPILLKGNVSRFFSSSISRYFLIYTISILAISLTSAFYNGSSSLLFLLLALRIKIYPLLIFILFLNYLDNHYNSNRKLDKYFSVIMIIQLIILPIEYIIFHFDTTFFESLVRGPINIYDVASGTFGAGETGVIGVFAILIFLFEFTYYKKTISFLYLLVIIFIFSGGTYVLMLCAFLLLIISKSISVKKVLKITFPVLIFVILTIFFSKNILKNNLFEYSINLIQKKWDSQVYERAEIGAGQLQRYGGIFYITNLFHKHENSLIGFGPTSMSFSKTFEVNNNKKIIPYRITNEFLMMPMELGYLGLIILFLFYVFIVKDCFKFYSKNQLFKSSLLIFIIFILANGYIMPLRSFPLMVYFSYSLAKLSVVQINENRK